MVYLYLAIVLVLTVQIAFVLLFFKKAYIICGPEEAIIKSGFGGTQVAWSRGVFVLPLIQRFTRVNLSAAPVEIQFNAARPLRFSKRETETLTIIIWLTPTIDEEHRFIVDGVKEFGAEGLTDQERLEKYYGGTFRQAIEAKAKTSTRDDWFGKLPEIPTALYETIDSQVEDFHTVYKITIAR